MDWNTLPGGDSKYEKLPPIGGQAEYDIEKIVKVTKEDDPRGRFWVTKEVEEETKSGKKVKVKVSQDWRLDVYLANGKIMTLASLSPIIALKQSGVNDGMKIQIARPEKGVYMINILGQSEKTITHEEEEEEVPPDLEEETPF